MWKIYTALPNISVDHTIGNSVLCIVPFNDSRIADLKKQNSFCKSYAEGFEDVFRDKIEPSFLLVENKTLRTWGRDINPIISFRNILTLSTIVKSVESHTLQGTEIGPTFSDYFSLFPVTISKGKGYESITPARKLRVIDSPHFRGQCSPSLNQKFLTIFDYNKYLLNVLLSLWEHHFQIGMKTQRIVTSLFRSLEMAFHAMALPSIGEPTLYEKGVRVSLWVSAFETLVHPLNSCANEGIVLKCVEQFPWAQVTWKNLNTTDLAKNVYEKLYSARNAFLHGNEINFSKLYFPVNSEKILLIAAAPVIFSALLLNILDGIPDLQTQIETNKPKRQEFYKKLSDTLIRLMSRS